MILAFLILIPFLAGLAAWAANRWGPLWPRWVALAGLGVELFLACALWTQYADRAVIAVEGPWLVQLHTPWVPQLGISFSLAMDGLSLLMVVLTAFLGIASVICSWTEIEEKVGFFHFNLMTVIAGIIGVFLAMDLVLFYVFWEVMLVPMYFLIAIWGHENRIYAALKFFIFTQAGGLLMLAAILALYFVHGQETGVYTFNYFELLSSPAGRSSVWIMLGFFVAFVVKLPAVPFHTWLPDAHTEAPTAGSVILAGLLLKTGGYGLIRFVAQLFPDAAVSIAPWAMLLGVLSIIYGAVLAFAQSDLKRLVAYTSVSHLGFVLVGVFSWNPSGHAGRGHANDMSRGEHRRIVHPGGHGAGTTPYPGIGQHGRLVDRGSPHGWHGNGLCPRFSGPSGYGQLRGRVPRTGRHLSHRAIDGCGGCGRNASRGDLCALDDTPGLFRPWSRGSAHDPTSQAENRLSWRC